MMRTLCGALLVMLAVGCGSDDDGGNNGSNNPATGGGSNNNGNGSNNNGSGRTGVTACGEQQCQAGQYCWNFACINGCLSDDNCTASQVCEKDSGEDEGSCQAAPMAGPEKDCAAFVAQCTTCGDDAGLCQQVCDWESNACVACVIQTGGCNAYDTCAACEDDDD